MFRPVPVAVSPAVSLAIPRGAPLALPAVALIAFALATGMAPGGLWAQAPASPTAGPTASPAATSAPTPFGSVRINIGAPVDIRADQLQVNQNDGSATFSGNVLIAQDDMKLSAQTVTVVYAGADQRRIRSLVASGGVTLVSGTDAAESKDADYDVEAGIVTLIGDVLVVRDNNVLSGDRMVIDLADGTANMQGGVRSILHPDTP